MENKTKKAASYIEIIILVTAIFAFSYILSSDKIESQETQTQTYKPSLLLNFLNSWYKRSQIGIVSATTTETTPTTGISGFEFQNSGSLTFYCCSQTKNNASCMDLPSSTCQDQCSVDCIQTSCSLTQDCKKGCCFDSVQGTCAYNSPQQNCTQPGIWKDDESCNVPECQKGCCTIGSETMFVSQTRCNFLVSLYGNMSSSFESGIFTELGCLVLSHSQVKGACVLQNKNCKFITQAECAKMRGSFSPEMLCTSSSLDTNCQKTRETTCIEGRDEVYFKDSCGNPANIYDAGKYEDTNYWERLSNQTCGSNGNINSRTCGNCNRFFGSACGTGSAEIGNKICKDLTCKNAPDNIGTKDRKNGESWCVFDGYIGDGKDVVGSRQYKYYCLDGEVKSENCGDFRTGVCVETRLVNSEMDYAVCRPNRAMECTSYNSEQSSDNTEAESAAAADKIVKKCEENPDCQVRTFNFGIGYKFSVCSPKYPPGFDVVNNGETTKKICNQANFKCTKIEQLSLISGWVCVAGCDCTSKKFTQQMNDWCISMGDCGGKANILGKTTEDGYSVDKAPKIDLKQYEKYSKPVEGQKVESVNSTEIMKNYYGWGAPSGPTETLNQSEINLLINVGVAGLAALGVSGGYSSMVQGAIARMTLPGGIAGGNTPVGVAAAAETSGGQAPGLFGPSFLPSLLASIIGAAIGYFVAKMFGLQGEAVTVVISSGSLAAAGAVFYFGAFTSYGWWACFGPQAIVCLAIVIIVVIIMSIIMKILGIGETRTTEVIFTCDAWQPPSGGADCKKCTDELNKDGLRDCSRYRCQSLGQTCELLNAGTGNEICQDVNPNDLNPPKISVWNDFISPGYEYASITDSGFTLKKVDEPCIQEFTPVAFGIQTKEEASQCKMDATHTADYNSMQYFFGESNLYAFNHSMVLNMPSVDSIVAGLRLNSSDAVNMTEYLRNKQSDMTFFVRCKDKKGNINPQEYLIKTCIKAGPDLTAPYVTKTEPATNSWVGYNQTKIDFKAYVSEPADCKYSFSDKSYSEMENTMACKKNYFDSTAFGWPCSANLTLTNYTIYIKCKDQPWLADSNSSRNTIVNSQIVSFQKTGELKIEELRPTGNLIYGTIPATVNLYARTSGGVPNQVRCAYSFTSYENMAWFFNSFSSEHRQSFTSMPEGAHEIRVKCSDYAGNEASKSTSFQVTLDVTSPRILRVLNQNGLKIITDEDSECAYSNVDCTFPFQNGTKMTGLLREHTSSIDQGKTYYVKCKDLYDKVPGGCSIIVRASDL